MPKDRWTQEEWPLPATPTTTTRHNIRCTVHCNTEITPKQTQHMMHSEHSPACLKPRLIPMSTPMRRALSTRIPRWVSTKRRKVHFRHPTQPRGSCLHRRHDLQRSGWYDNNARVIHLLFDEAIRQKEAARGSTAKEQTDWPPSPNPFLMLPEIETISVESHTGEGNIHRVSDEQPIKKVHFGENHEMPLMDLHQRTRREGSMTPQREGRTIRTGRLARAKGAVDSIAASPRRSSGGIMRRPWSFSRRGRTSAAAASRSRSTSAQQDTLVARFESMGLSS